MAYPNPIGPLARDEWLAWRTVCMLLRRRGVDVDDPQHEDLVRAMRHHAEAYRRLFEGKDAPAEAAADERATRALYEELDR